MRSLFWPPHIIFTLMIDTKKKFFFLGNKFLVLLFWYNAVKNFRLRDISPKLHIFLFFLLATNVVFSYDHIFLGRILYTAVLCYSLDVFSIPYSHTRRVQTFFRHQYKCHINYGLNTDAFKQPKSA